MPKSSRTGEKPNGGTSTSHPSSTEGADDEAGTGAPAGGAGAAVRRGGPLGADFLARHGRKKDSEFCAEPAVAPDRGGIAVFRSSTLHQPPRQVNGIVIQEA